MQEPSNTNFRVWLKHDRIKLEKLSLSGRETDGNDSILGEYI